MTIEVEKRALLDESRYHELLVLLDERAEDKGENDTVSVFYLRERSQIKVQRNETARTAKIAWKSGGVDGAEQRHELELPIGYDDFDAANELMRAVVSDAQVFPTKQTRHDYLIDDIDVAIKYSDDWGYHAELEIVVDDDARVEDALTRIHALADTLDIQLLSEDEERDFVAAHIAARGGY